MASAAVTLVTIGAPAALLAACGDTTSHSGTASTVLAPNATVVRVVDGDTIVVDLGGQTERVRLIGVNTPETVDPRVPVQCFGREASDHLHEMLPE
ncbi:MAG TPA: thermonuclease family protein, partial [Microthrixaceae bacterium]|nr:thermonuclease family protein [Microthrixaceae bacterium]